MSSVGAPSRSFSVSRLPQAFKSLGTSKKQAEAAFVKLARCKNLERNLLQWTQQNIQPLTNVHFQSTHLCFPLCLSYQCISQLLPFSHRRACHVAITSCNVLIPIQVTCQCCNPLCGSFPGKPDEQIRHWTNMPWTSTAKLLCHMAASLPLPITTHRHLQVNSCSASSANPMSTTLRPEAFFLAFFLTCFYTLLFPSADFFLILNTSSDCCLSVLC